MHYVDLFLVTMGAFIALILSGIFALGLWLLLSGIGL